MEDGGLVVPNNPKVLGWWTGGAHPGSSSGTVVVDGHVDSAVLGLGSFFYLYKVTIGSRITMTTDHGSLTYRVVARRLYPKPQLPSADIFATAGQPRLILITCGGSFNRAIHSYRDNVVVYAVPE